MRMRRFRFSLAALLLLISAAAAFFGFAQWRRQRIIEQCESLRRDGVLVMLPSDAVDRIWQRNPTTAMLDPARFNLVIDWHMAKDWERVQAQIKELGISDLQAFSGAEDDYWKAFPGTPELN
jgi:hypothetical protein